MNGYEARSGGGRGGDVYISVLPFYRESAGFWGGGLACGRLIEGVVPGLRWVDIYGLLQ
jgi:hypothetical protein